MTVEIQQCPLRSGSCEEARRRGGEEARRRGEEKRREGEERRGAEKARRAMLKFNNPHLTSGKKRTCKKHGTREVRGPEC